ncbi:MAG: CoB--CoM heterodisulfide reductase iron-sulfur subunit B family protein [Candidatus Eisenbacteria bacterium]
MKTESVSSKYTFFPGCLARLKLPQVESSVRIVLGDLGIDLVEEKRFTCCPDPVVFRSASRRDWLSLAARNLALDGGAPIVTLCPGCASSLSEARHILEHDEAAAAEISTRLKKLSMNLAIPPVSHFLKILSQDSFKKIISEKITKTFEGLKVACHYGCHLVRPSDAVEFDDPEKPTTMDDLVALLGAEPLDYEDKYLCCGRPSLDEATSMSIAQHKLECMQAAGAQAIVLACPFCFEQFDLGQLIIGRKSGKKFDIPVLYASQLLGLAMGREPAEMGLNLHKIKFKGVS